MKYSGYRWAFVVCGALTLALFTISEGQKQQQSKVKQTHGRSQGRSGLNDRSSIVGWPMEGFDRHGTAQAAEGPLPATLTTPWIFTELHQGDVTHGAAIRADGIGFYGTMNGEQLVKFDTSTGAILGAFDALNNVQCTPAIGSNGLVYISTPKSSSSHPQGRLFAVDPVTMDWVWFFDTFYLRLSDYESASPTLGPDGDVVIPSRSGKVWRLDGDNGSVVWEATVAGSPEYTVPFSRDNTKVFVMNSTNLTALNYSDGTVAWNFVGSLNLAAPGVAPDGTVVVGEGTGTVYGLDPDTGALNWSFGTLGQITGAPAFSDDVAYVPSWDHRLYALRTSDGARLWSFTAGDDLRTKPAVGPDGRIYFGDWFTNLYCVAPDGTPIWHEIVGQSVLGPISIGPDGTVYVGTRAKGLTIIRQQAVFPPVDSFSLVRGQIVSGATPDLLQSDDSYLSLEPFITLSAAEAPVDIVLIGTAPSDSVSEFSFKIESRLSHFNISQEILLYNYDTNSWEQVDVRISATTDTTVEINIPTDPGRFVSPSLEMRARIKYKQAGIILSFPWTVHIDFGEWRVVPNWR